MSDTSTSASANGSKIETRRLPSVCCPRKASSHTATVPPTSVISSRRLMTFPKPKARSYHISWHVTANRTAPTSEAGHQPTSCCSNGSSSARSPLERHVHSTSNSRRRRTSTACPGCAMCGRLRVGKSLFHVLQHWSVQPCVRPLDAAHMTAGHNALADRVPTNNSHSRMPWHMWVVLIAGSTGSALRAVRPPNHFKLTPVAQRDLVHRASAAVPSCIRSPTAIMTQTIRAILLASAIAATLVGRLASKAVSQGQCLVPWILA